MPAMMCCSFPSCSNVALPRSLLHILALRRFRSTSSSSAFVLRNTTCFFLFLESTYLRQRVVEAPSYSFLLHPPSHPRIHHLCELHVPFLTRISRGQRQYGEGKTSGLLKKALQVACADQIYYMTQVWAKLTVLQVPAKPTCLCTERTSCRLKANIGKQFHFAKFWDQMLAILADSVYKPERFWQ